MCMVQLDDVSLMVVKTGVTFQHNVFIPVFNSNDDVLWSVVNI